MKTENEKVVGEVQVWAIPRSQYYMDENPNALPFKYELSTTRIWSSGAVQVFETEVTIEVPGGIDLMTKAVETLKAEMVDVRAESEARLNKIQERINSLLLLEHKPDLEVV